MRQRGNFGKHIDLRGAMPYNMTVDNRQNSSKRMGKQMGKFVIKQNKRGYTFSLKAANGEVVATCGEVLSSLASCRNSIESVIKNAPIADLEDQTTDKYQTAKCPKFEIYLDKKGEFRFRLKARNGEFILASEGYSSKGGCKNGIESVRKNVVDAAVVGPEAE